MKNSVRFIRFHVDEVLFKKLKRLCLDTDVTLQALLSKLVEEMVNENKDKTKEA